MCIWMLNSFLVRTGGHSKEAGQALPTFERERPTGAEVGGREGFLEKLS